MKTLYIIISAIMIAGFGIDSFGQTERGRFMAGTGSNMSFNSYSTKWSSSLGNGDNGKSSDFTFYPSVGYFPLNNLSAGISLLMDFSTTDNEGNKESSNSYVFSPFIRYYVGKGNVKPFINAGIGFGGGKSISEFNSTTLENSYTTSSYEISGGMAYFINNNLSVDFKIGFNSSTNKSDEDNNVTYKSTANNFGMGLAFNFIFF